MSTGEPNDGAVIGENADHVSATLDLPVEPFERIGAGDLRPMLFGIDGVGENIVAGRRAEDTNYLFRLNAIPDCPNRMSSLTSMHTRAGTKVPSERFVIGCCIGENVSPILAYVTGLNWTSLISGAVLGAIGVGIRVVVQAPVKALIEHAQFIRLLSFLSPQRPFTGSWHVAWKVESRRFPTINEDTVRVYRLLSNITFTTVATLKDGSTEKCVFVGKLIDRTVTGRWHNPEDVDRGYFGSFQFRLHGSLKTAVGSWIGWSNDGLVQANEMTLERRNGGTK